MKPVPAISELLRTGHLAPLLLRVDRIVPQEVVTEDKKGKARVARVHRIFLSDDQLIIQALLQPNLGLEIAEGDILKIHKYTVRKARKLDQSGQIVFLAVQDCDIVAQADKDPSPTPAEDQGGFIRDKSASTFTAPSARSKRRSSDVSDLDPTVPPPSKQPRLALSFEVESDSESEPAMSAPSATQQSDDFETFTPNKQMTQFRRQALRELDPTTLAQQNSSVFREGTAAKSSHLDCNKTHLLTPQKSAAIKSPSPPTLSQPIAAEPQVTHLARLSETAPSTPVSILAVITWTGQTLLRPSPAFPPKRQIKLHDISIGNLFLGVSLAVYIDATNFKPPKGTVALFQDVVVQRCGSGGGDGEVNMNFMLNAYANPPTKLHDKGVESNWYIDDETQLSAMGLEAEVEELKEWWADREGERSSAV